MSSENNTDTTQHHLVSPETKLLFILVTVLFLLWGIANNLNDILIKQFMKSFELSRFQAGLVQSAFYMGYFCLSMPAALIMRKYGYKTGLVTGLFLYAAGTFLFWPAAEAAQYSYFLVALFVIAAGLAFLETGANPFVAVLGDPATSEKRLNLAQAFNPLGAVAGVLMGTLFIFSGTEHTPEQIEALKAAGEHAAYLKSETMRVVTPYAVLGGVVLLWGILLLTLKFPHTSDQAEKGETEKKSRVLDLLKYPHFIQGVIAQFFYVGAQVGTWSYYIQYVQDYTGQTEKVAGGFLTGTLVAFGIGRFVSTWLMNYFAPARLMGLYGIINIALCAVGFLFPNWVGVWAIFATSFFMSLMFPTIFALGIKGLGPNTKVGGSLIVMAIIGGAVFTPLMGFANEFGGIKTAMLVPLFCYVVVAYYALVGCRVKLPEGAETQQIVGGGH